MAQLTAREVAEMVSEYGGSVLVIEGEPDYHVDRCRALTGRDVEETDVLDARDDGFHPCRACRPDGVLAGEAVAEQAAFQAKQVRSAQRPLRVAPPSSRPLPVAAAVQPHSAPVAVRVPVAAAVRMPVEQYAPAGKQFVFDGGAATYVGTGLLAFVITVVTLGFCYPFALVLKERWRAKHSLINGQRLIFTGSATGLFGLWIKWLLLIFVTVGIYSLWVGPRIARWKWQHTGFENQVVVRPVV